MRLPDTVKVSLLVLGTIALAPFLLLADECCSYVQSTAMLPTLKPNDKVGFVRYNIAPEPGDLIVFKNSGSTQIKRLIGLPGSQIQMTKGILFINGRPTTRTRMPDYISESGPIKKWREVLPNGVAYDTLKMIDNSMFDTTPVFDVPPSSYFVLSDNRDNGTDSRAPIMGFITAKDVIGKVTLH